MKRFNQVASWCSLFVSQYYNANQWRLWRVQAERERLYHKQLLTNIGKTMDIVGIDPTTSRNFVRKCEPRALPLSQTPQLPFSRGKAYRNKWQYKFFVESFQGKTWLNITEIIDKQKKIGDAIKFLDKLSTNKKISLNIYIGHQFDWSITN